MQSKLLRLGAAGVMSLSLGAFGVVGATSGTIDTTGPGSTNEVIVENDVTSDVDNDTDIEATNRNPQRARSGRAVVRHNTTGGDATSGAAANDSLLRATVDVDNGDCGCDEVDLGGGDFSGDISNTGPDSDNLAQYTNTVDWSVDNDTDITINNHNSQSANSGYAAVTGNTTGGDATSGDASNIGTVELEISVSN